MEMVSCYTENVPFKVGEVLKKIGYWDPRCTYSCSYNGPCYFSGSKKFYGDGVVAPWEEIVPAPTYAEVIDWFVNTKNIIIILDPFFTYSLRDHIAYNWKIYYLDGEKNLILVTENDEYTSDKGYGGSFKLTANDAIMRAAKIQN